MKKNGGAFAISRKGSSPNAGTLERGEVVGISDILTGRVAHFNDVWSAQVIDVDRRGPSVAGWYPGPSGELYLALARAIVMTGYRVVGSLLGEHGRYRRRIKEFQREHVRWLALMQSALAYRVLMVAGVEEGDEQPTLADVIRRHFSDPSLVQAIAHLIDLPQAQVEAAISSYPENEDFSTWCGRSWNAAAAMLGERSPDVVGTTLLAGELGTAYGTLLQAVNDEHGATLRSLGSMDR